MDAIELLVADHRRIRAMFADLDEARESGDRADQGRVAGRVASELAVHSAVEEEIYYPWVRSISDELKAMVDEGREEHHVANVLLDELAELTPGDDQWLAKVEVLAESVDHHLAEEEEEMFVALRSATTVDQRREHGQAMAARREELESGAGPGSRLLAGGQAQL